MEINTEFMTDAFLRALQPYPPLSSIVLYVTKELTNEAIESLAINCPSLTILSLRASTDDGAPLVTDTAVQAIETHCPRLQ